MTNVLTLDTVYEQLAQVTGIPLQELHDPATLLGRLPQMGAEMASCLIGQSSAVDTIMAALRSRLLRKRASRPILNLLCVGPSGVGKTETAKQLARICLGDATALHRFDCSEFAEPHTVAKLIGSPAGYVGYGEGGLLTEAVRRRPRSVVLMDEIEKAAPQVRHLLLQTLDSGRLTDGAGETVDFRRTLLVFTSNLGNEWVGQVPDRESYETQIRSALAKNMAPEFLGRFDGVVVYRHLQAEDLFAIVTLKLKSLADEIVGLSELEPTSRAVAAVLAEANAPDSGAREVDRVIRRHVDPHLTKLLVSGRLGSATQFRARLDHDGSNFVITDLSDDEG